MTHPAGCHCQGPLDACCSADHKPDPAGGRRVDALIDDFRRRTGQPESYVKDAAFSYQWHSLAETLKRLDVILEDMDGRMITPALRTEVIRYMLYGAPSEAEADLRMDLMDGTKQLLEKQTLPEVGVPPRS